MQYTRVMYLGRISFSLGLAKWQDHSMFGRETCPELLILKQIPKCHYIKSIVHILFYACIREFTKYDILSQNKVKTKSSLSLKCVQECQRQDRQDGQESVLSSSQCMERIRSALSKLLPSYCILKRAFWICVCVWVEERKR